MINKNDLSGNSVVGSSRSVAAARMADWTIFLVPSSPLLFALLTWNERGETDPAAAATRLLGLPILALEACLVVIAFARGWRPIEAMRRLKPTVAVLLASLIVVAFGTATFAAPSRLEAFVWTYILFAHVVFAFAAAWMISHWTKKELRLVWPLVVIGCCGYAIMLAIFVFQPHRANFDWVYLGFGVSNLRQVGFYATVGGLSALGCALQRRGAATARFGFASALMFAAAFWTGCRGAVVAAIIAVLLASVLFRWMRNARALAYAVLAMIGGGAISTVLPLPSRTTLFGIGRIAKSVSGPAAQDVSSGRFEVWRDAWRAILHRPLFGYGAAQFGEVAPQPQGTYLHPHNIVLQVLFQWGVIGFLLSAGLFVVLIRKCWLRSRGGSEAFAPAILVGLGLFVYSLYDGALFHAYPVMVFAFAIAFIASGDHSDRDEDTSGPRMRMP